MLSLTVMPEGQPFICLGIVAIGVMAFTRLRFPAAAITYGVVLAAYAAELTLRPGVAGGQVIEAALVGAIAILIGMMSRSVERARREVFYERLRSEELLLNVLPVAIASRLKDGRVIADAFEEVTVMFSDIVGFTELSARMTPAKLVEMLDDLFSRFDALAEKHNLEKIKTIGDAYMIAGGIPLPRSDHAQAVVAMGLEMQAEVASFAAQSGMPLSLRVGIHTGPVVAGVIGKKKFAYDLWGDTVNLASRMESHGLAGRVQVTATTWELVKHAYDADDRGTIDVKGKGRQQAFLLKPRAG